MTERKDDYLDREFNFDKAIRNPYAKELKKQITIKLFPSVIDYFKLMAEKTGIPYQTLINLYLADCAEKKLKIDIRWTSE